MVREMSEAYRARRAARRSRSRRSTFQPALGGLLRVGRRLCGGLALDGVRQVLIEREHVAVAPGSAFGELGEGYVRLSLASSREDLLSSVEKSNPFTGIGS